MVPLRQVHDLFPGFLFLQKSSLDRLRTQDDIVQYRKTFYQLKMLMYHTDSQSVCIIGILDMYGFPVFPYLSFLRLIQSEQHTHQCRFPCAVFTQKGMDLAFFQLQCNVIICHNTGKSLGYIQHFNCVFSHFASSFPHVLHDRSLSFIYLYRYFRHLVNRIIDLDLPVIDLLYQFIIVLYCKVFIPLCGVFRKPYIIHRCICS